MKRWEIAGESDNRAGMAHNWKITKTHTHTHTHTDRESSWHPLLSVTHIHTHTRLNFTSVWCYFFLSTLQGIKSHFSLIPFSQFTFECICSRMCVCVCVPERTPVCVGVCKMRVKVLSLYMYIYHKMCTHAHITLSPPGSFEIRIWCTIKNNIFKDSQCKTFMKTS